MVWKKRAVVSALVGVITLAASWTVWTLAAQQPQRPAAGTINRTRVDGSGHTRGIVQIDLMRQYLAQQAQQAPVLKSDDTSAPSRNHPLLDRPAPALSLCDASGKTWDLNADGPTVVVFYLGATCVACVTHLVALDAARARFQQRSARILAISGDTPEFTRNRTGRFGALGFPLLSDVDHAAARAFGAWNAVDGGAPDDGEALHGTFLLDRGGNVRWAYVGDRPFADVDTLIAELDRLSTLSIRETARKRERAPALQTP